MSTYTLPRVGLSGLRELPDAPPPPPPQPPIAPPDDDEPPLRDQVDALVKENRKRATPDVLEKRKIPRVSISELNAMDLDQIRERLQASSFDGRGPVTKVLDLLDVSRNQIAATMFPTLEKRAREAGDTGTGGTGNVHGSDILRDFGVNNNVVAGVGGFALDFAMDPFTYAGPAGWAARLATSTKVGKGAVMAIRGAGNRALRRSIKDVARGRAARDAIWAPVIADAGYDAGKVAELAASGKTAKQIRAEIDTALRGPLESGRVGRVFSGIGGDLDYEGGHLNRMFNQTPLEAGLDDATLAKVKNVRNAVKKYGKGTGPSLRLGVEKGAVGSEIAHIPFTDITLQVPSFSSATGQAILAQRIANGLDSGLTRAAVLGDVAARGIVHEGDRMASLAGDADVNSQGVTAARKAHADETFGLPPDEPPPEPPAGPDFVNPKDRPPAPPPGGPLFNPDAPRSPGDVAPGGAPKPAAETPDPPGDSWRSNVVEQTRAAFGPELSPEQVDAVAALNDARAKVWAKATGRSVDDWWRETYAGVERGAVAADEAPAGVVDEVADAGDSLGQTRLDRPPDLFQGNRGAVQFLDDGRAIVRALSAPDFSTLVHETGHIFRRDLLAPERAAAESAYGVTGGNWTVDAEEAFARDFETYIGTGEAPSDELRGVFERMRDWMVQVYRSITGTPLESQLDENTRRLFDRILTGGDEGLSAADEATDLAAAKAGRPRPSAAVLGSKAEIMRRLDGMWSEAASAEREFDHAAGIAERASGGPGQSVEFTTSFSGEVPTEIKEALQGQRYLLSKIHGNVPGGAGEDSWSALGSDEWIRQLRALFEGRETATLRAANSARGHDPVTTLYMHLLDSWPWKGNRVKKVAADLDELDPDTAFTINGHQFLVVTDADGDTAIRYADGPDVPPEALGEFGIDAGSIRTLSEDEAIEMAAELSPPLPERPDLMFQGPRDVPGQSGLFTGRPTTGVTGGQRTLGLEPPPAPAQAPNPMARIPGESDEDFKLRVKWTKPSVIQGTDTLFQGPTGPLTPEERDALRTQGDTPLLPPNQDVHTGPGGATGASGVQEPLTPLTPRQVADARLAEAEARYAARREEILAEAQAARDTIAGAMAALDPKEAAKSLSSADRMIVFGRELEEAQAAVDALAVDKSQLARAKGLLGSPGAFDESKKAEILREMSERFYTLAKTNPEALEDVIRLNAEAFAAKGKYADALRGVLATFEDGPMTAARLHAMSILGTDDYNIAVTLFNPMGRWSRRKLGDDHALTRTLFGLDNAVRKTFGVRGGALERNLVHYKLGMKDRDRESVRVSKAMERDVGRALAKSGVKGPDATNDAMAIVHAEMYRLADPEGSVYHWTKWGDKGPEGPSLLLDKLEAAKAKGYFDPKTHPGLLDDLKAIAQKQIDEYRQIGDSELRDFTLGSLMAGHVPLVPSRPAARAIREAAGASVQHPGRVSRVGGEGFDHMRTTWQTRFFDPGQVGPTLTDPNAGGRWRRFFHGDRDLAALSKPEFERKFEGRSAAERAEAAEAVEAIKRYDELVAADPAFAEKHPARATDFVEANELYAKGRWRRLTMSDAKVTDFFETNPAHVSGVRMGMHQQSRVKASMLNMVLKNNILLRHEDDLLRVAKDGEQTVRLQSGVVAKVGGLVKTNAGDSAASVLIGDRRYRQLSPSLRSSLDSNPIMEAMGQDAGRMLFPHELADRIEGVVAATATDANLDGVLGMVNAVTSHWKMATLFSPSWAVFNVLGDGIMALAGGARLDHMADPESIRDMWAIRRALNDPAKLAGKTTNVLGREMPMSEVLGLALKHRIFDNSLTIEAASHALLDVEFQRGLMQRLPGYDQLMRRVVGPFFRANQFVQDGMRMLAFASFIRQGHSPVAAEQAVLRSMLDYADFTRVEERYFRTIFPFYSWMRGNLGYQFRMLLERPSYAAAVPRVKEAIEEAVNGEDGVPENMRPTWMREQLATQVGTDPQRRIAVMLGNMLPQGDLFQALTPVVGVDGAMNFMHYFASQLNPALSVPLQLGAGVETFSGRTIGPSREEGDIGAGEFLASQVRPLAEYGPGGRLWKAADEGGAAGAGARFLIGGRSQGFGQDRIDSSLTREYDDRVRRMQAAVHRAERAGDRATSLRARTRLMQVYAEMQGKGLQVPKWAAEQLGTFAE